jgi:hypothetical protein
VPSVAELIARKYREALQLASSADATVDTCRH